MEFDFSYLINKYATDLTILIPNEEKYDDMGELVKIEPTKKTIHGALISHRETKIFKSNGTLTEQDKALYMLEPLENSLQGAKITDGDKVYHIGSLLENSEFTGVWAYGCKFVSVFSEVSNNV